MKRGDVPTLYSDVGKQGINLGIGQLSVNNSPSLLAGVGGNKEGPPMPAVGPLPA